MMEEELNGNIGEMRRGVSKVWFTMMAATLIYWLIPNAVMLLVRWYEESRQVYFETGTLYGIEFLCLYLLVMPLMIFLLSRLPGTKLPRHKVKVKQFLGILAAVYGIMIACSLFGTVVASIVAYFTKINIQNEDVVDMVMNLDVSMSVVFVSIVGPVFEELIFRKMLVTRLVKYGEGVAIVLSGLIFGIFHGNWTQFVYTFGLGMFLAFVFLKTGNILYTMAIHVCINFSSSVILLNLVKMADYDQLVLAAKAFDEGRLLKVADYVSSHVLPLIGLYAYLILEYTIAFVGIVLLLIFHKQMKLEKGEYEASRKEKAKAMFLNLGVLGFALTWIAIKVFHLM